MFSLRNDVPERIIPEEIVFQLEECDDLDGSDNKNNND